MKVISFIEDHKVIDWIIGHLKLAFRAERPPPPQALHQELLMAAEERGEYFSGASWRLFDKLIQERLRLKLSPAGWFNVIEWSTHFLFLKLRNSLWKKRAKIYLLHANHLVLAQLLTSEFKNTG